MAEEVAAPLVVRGMPPRGRHPRIFEVLYNLRPGQALRLINDHDPRPLYYRLMSERPGQFLWRFSVEGPDQRIVVGRQNLIRYNRLSDYGRWQVGVAACSRAFVIAALDCGRVSWSDLPP